MIYFMKKTYLHVLFALLFTFSVSSQKEKIYTSKKERKKFYTSLLELYGSTEVKYIWDTDAQEENFEKWVGKHTESALIDDLETIIHELFHGLCIQHSKGLKYHVGKEIVIDVPFSKTFNSKELNTFIRKGQQDSIYRYAIYVGGKNELPGGGKITAINSGASDEASSVQIGIYGMMEEFTAYYFSLLTSYPLKSYYEREFGMLNQSAWYNYRHMMEDNILAYFEFRFFMGSYMLYAKEKYPEVYDGIMKNNSLRVVYTLIVNRFRKLIGLYNDALIIIPQNAPEDLIHKMDFSGSDEDLAIFARIGGVPKEQVYSEDNNVTLSKEYIKSIKPEYEKYISGLKKQMQGEMYFYFASPEKQYNYLIKQITPSIENELEGLFIKGCNDNTYKNFLK
jgi:hypothetical protein